MSDSGYTPHKEKVVEAWLFFTNRNYEDPKQLRAGTAEMNRFFAAHDAVIREDQAKKDAEIAEVRAQEYMSNINAVWADQARMNMDSRMGAGFSLKELATLLRGQSFTGTEKNDE